MLAFLPSPILLLINIILIPLNSVLIAIPIMILGLIRFLLPIKPIIIMIEKANYVLYMLWVFNNRLIISITNNIKWHITGDEIPSTKKSW